jgi:hypothetical protein
VQRLDCPQYSPEWWQARVGRPTVSEFSRFITPAKGDLSKQADGYIAEMLVEELSGLGDEIQSQWMTRGLNLEDDARSFYEFEYDCDVEQCGVILNKGAGWSPDGLIANKGGLEIKCPKPSTHVQWLIKGGLPDDHKPQCHGALLIGELDWIDFISYCPGFRPLIVRITPSDYTVKVESALAAFLIRYESAKQFIQAAA